MSDDVTPLRTDAVRATEYRDRLRPLLSEFVDTLNQAEREGLLVIFNIGRDAFGRHALATLIVAKML